MTRDELIDLFFPEESDDPDEITRERARELIPEGPTVSCAQSWDAIYQGYVRPRYQRSAEIMSESIGVPITFETTDIMEERRNGLGG